MPEQKSGSATYEGQQGQGNASVRNVVSRLRQMAQRGGNIAASDLNTLADQVERENESGQSQSGQQSPSRS